MPLSVIAILAFSAVPVTHAYGNTDQWQAGFAGTAHGGSFGFWGWCAFGGSDGSSAPGTTGTTADCQISNYFRPFVNNFHVQMDGSGWVIALGSPFVPPGVPSFFFTGGTAELTGPGAKALGLPVGVPFPLSTPGVCDFSNIPVSLFFSPCDTGIPAKAGHFAFNTGGPTGFEFQLQVTKLP